MPSLDGVIGVSARLETAATVAQKTTKAINTVSCANLIADVGRM
ncbi:MAG: hypothetical protein R3B05_15230 [Nitrospira sp.]